MTTYTTISDARVAPEAPLDTSLITQLRDNPLSIVEGNSTVKIQTAALQDYLLTAQKFPLVVAGTTYEITEPSDETSTTLTSYTKLYESLVALAGTVNVYFGIKTGNASYPTYARIYVNGTPVGVERSTTSLSYVYYSEDISITYNDRVQVYVKQQAVAIGYLIDVTLRASVTLPGTIVRTV